MPRHARIRSSSLRDLVSSAIVRSAQASRSPVALQTNQSYVEELARPTALDIDDLMAVFGFVWRKLPERVKVYPTENYYYVGFFHNGIRYAGNIRLDASNRDDGKVVFAYFEDTSQWFEERRGQIPRARCHRTA